jgi:hypothetical protein
MQQKPAQQAPMVPLQEDPSDNWTHCPLSQTWQVGVLPHVCPFREDGSHVPFTHAAHSGQSSSVQQTEWARQAPPQQTPSGGQKVWSGLATHWRLSQALQPSPPQSCPCLAGLGLHEPSAHTPHSPHSASVQQFTHRSLPGQQRWPCGHRGVQA